MSTLIRTCLVLSLTALVTCAYSPVASAGKKDGSSSNSDDKKKDKGGDQNNQSSKRDRNRNEIPKPKFEQTPNVQQVVNPFKGDNKNKNSDKQDSSKNSQQVVIGNGSQTGQSQKSPWLTNPQQPQLDKLQKQQSQNKGKQPQWPTKDNQPQWSNGQNQLPSPNDQKQPQLESGQKLPQWQNNKQPQLQSNKLFDVKKNNDHDKWDKKGHHDHKDVHNWVKEYGGSKPFSKKWYKEHPHAWHHHHRHHHHDHDDDDAWQVATAVGVLGFLGWSASHHHHDTVVVYQPVPYDRIVVQRPGVVVDPARGDWMPLGVFSLTVGPGDASTRIMDLAVDRWGHVRGTYVDMISGATHDVVGIIDQRTQYAQWCLESNRQLTFYTPLEQLTQSQGFVYVQFPSGQRHQWQLDRMERN